MLFSANVQRDIWLKLFTRQPSLAISSGKGHVALRHRPRVRAAAVLGAVFILLEVGRVFGWSALLCSLGAACCWFACLLCAALRFCLVLSCYNEAPLLVRVCAGRGQPLCPWDRGDKVVSSCWWVRACFIHPETLFQTLSQVISRRIRPRLAPRTPFNNNPAGAVFHRLL